MLDERIGVAPFLGYRAGAIIAGSKMPLPYYRAVAEWFLGNVLGDQEKSVKSQYAGSCCADMYRVAFSLDDESIAMIDFMLEGVQEVVVPVGQDGISFCIV